MGISSVLDWEYFPQLCLFTILEKIGMSISLVQFGAVSRHWHSVFNTFLDIKRQSSPNLVPMLLIPSRKSCTKRKLYNLQSKSKVSEIEFPKPYTWRCCGSCYGWLVTVDDNLIITLSNPFKNNISINLPPHHAMDIDSSDFQDKITKVVLSDDPLLHPNNYAVIVIYSSYGRLAFYKPCQKDWIYINRDESMSNFGDIFSHKSLVYAIGHYSSLVSFDVNGGVEDNESSKSPDLNILVPNVWRSELYLHRTYIIKSSMGNIYSIHKYLEFDHLDEGSLHTTKKFRVFKLMLDHENGKLLERKEVESIDGDIVFVGDNGTLAVSALDFREGHPNSMYFTDDFIGLSNKPFGPRDIGIFHLKDGSLGKYYQFKSSHSDLSPYIWILPPPSTFTPTLSV